MSNYNNVSYGTTVVNATNIVATKIQSAVRQKLGRSVASINILGKDDSDWNLTVSGKITGTTATNLSANRANLEALDNADIHVYTDGIHDGNFFIEPGSLQFNDDGETHFSVYSYTMRLIEKR